MGYEISFLGLIVSLLFIGLTGLYPGGIIVPSYLVLYLSQPTRIVGTLAAALLSFFCYRLASRYLILFGRRRFVFLIFIGGALAFAGFRFLPFLAPASVEFRVIGWVVPGLIANQFERQGVLVTTASLVTIVVVVYFIGRMLSFIG